MLFRNLHVLKTSTVFLCLCMGNVLFALEPWLETTETPALTAGSALLIEAETNTILFEKNPKNRYPIASLTKLMTLYLALEDIEDGLYALDETVEIPKEAYASRQAAGSSLMFLSAGQVVRMVDLLFGLMISSGNDAAVALAIILEGDINTFVERMNITADMLGMYNSNFADPSGLDSYNYSNSFDIALLIQHMLERWEETVLTISSQYSYTYPNKNNILPEIAGLAHAISNPITQQNRNRLLWEYEGSDGLKTGYTEEAGYALSATASRRNRRLIAVLLSVPGNSHAEGGANRTSDAIALFDFGFNTFGTWELPTPTISSYIPGGTTVALTAQRAPLITIPKTMYEHISYEVKPVTLQWAPLPKGSTLAFLTYKLQVKLQSYEIFITPLISTENAEKGGFFHLMLDRIRWINRKESILEFPDLE